MSAIHLICRRDANGDLNYLSHDGGTIYRSGRWDINQHEAAELLNGWLYLHPTKKDPSEFGGRITAFEVVERTGNPHPIGIVFTLEARREAREQRWRGQDHGRAWTGGVVENSLPHEMEG
jgi:hypothetical protein